MADIDEFCANCKKPLEGVVEIIKTTFRGMKVLIFRDTPDRNWIRCTGCGSVVCKTCCRYPQIGYCNRCLRYIHEVSTEILQTALFTIPLGALRLWQEAVSNHHSQPSKGGTNQ